MVKQFVKLFAIQYGLTFCLYVDSLYEAPLHPPSRLSIRQLDLMSKSWNELLRHWRSSSSHVCAFVTSFYEYLVSCIQNCFNFCSWSNWKLQYWHVVLFRCFSDVKTAVWISSSSGLTTKTDLGILVENSGLVSATISRFSFFVRIWLMRTFYE